MEKFDLDKLLYIPPKLYHGTNAVFDAFDIECRGSNTGWPNTMYGLFFSDKIENARMFGSRIFEVSVRIKKPLNLTLPGIFNLAGQAPMIWELLSGQRLENKEALETLYEEIGLGEVGDMYDALHTEKSRGIFIQNGYDGIISDMGGDDNPEFVVFNDSQITIIGVPE